MDIYEFLKDTYPLENQVIIECGGHLGTDTQKLSSRYPNNILHSIEANK